MEKRIVECVPNFSEGRDKTVIDAITAAIVQSGGVKLLDVKWVMMDSTTATAKK